jgi:hypothetical protein
VDPFVKRCRREWRRLRVPDAVANEMATELETDLEEARAEGASAEEVLGSGVFDPRAFAESWAAERGVIPPPASRPRLSWRSPMLAAIIALTAIAAVGAGMVLASRVGAPRSVTLAAGPPFAYVRPDLRDCPRFAPPYPPPPSNYACVAQGEVIRGQTIMGGPPKIFRGILAEMPRSRLYPLGWILLIAGLAGIVLLLLISWALRRRPAVTRSP